MGQRAGSSVEADSDDEILGEPLLRDEVDDLVAAWRAQRPDLDVEPMQVLSRISRLARHLDIARRGAFADHELESWEFDVLSALRRQGPPFQLTPGALLRATLVTSGTMTNRIDRLAAEGLVRREPDPRDKRGVLSPSPIRARSGWTPRWPGCCGASGRCWRAWTTPSADTWPT
jgi:hypothetical protein